MKCKKLLSTLLAISVSVSTLAAATIPASADAPAKKTMNMGGSVIAKDDNIYYGDAKKFRVLSTVGNTTQNGATTETATYTDDNGNDIKGPLFVISENDFDTRAFDSGNNQMWQTIETKSEAKQWCNEIKDTPYESNGFYTAAGITTAEKAAILTTSKTDAAYNMFKATSINDKVFYLSAKEADEYFKDENDKIFKPGGGDAVWWWLRSPFEFNDNFVGIVDVDGSFSIPNAHINNVASRPAFNLNLSSVLFTSAAAGGKVSGTPTAYSGNEWKLTLKSDTYKDFALGDVTNDGTNVTVNFSNAILDDTKNWVSAIVTDSDGIIKYYSQLTKTAGATSVTVPLYAVGETDTLYLFNEEINGDYKTDYASELKEVTIPPDSFTVTANVNDTAMGSVTSSKAIAKVGGGVTLTAEAKPGYKLVDFTSDDVKVIFSGNEGMFTMPAKDVTVTAYFAATTGANAITAKSNFEGMGTVTSNKATAAYGEEVTLTAVAKTGNTFVEFASPDVNIGSDGKFIMPDKAVYVQAIFKANASFEDNTSTPIQAQKNDDGTAILRFMWGLTKADGAYIANIGAYIIPWSLFKAGSAARPAIVLISEPTMKTGDTFSADYIGIPDTDGNYDTEYCAIPFINGTFFTDALLTGTVNGADIDK